MPSPRPTAHLTALVQRDQCRPDLLCIACREPMGDRHKLLCSMWKSAVEAFRTASKNGSRTSAGEYIPTGGSLGGLHPAQGPAEDGEVGAAPEGDAQGGASRSDPAFATDPASPLNGRSD